MPALDTNALNTLIYNRIATHSDGSAIRALLGASATSVIHVKDMDKPLPATPFVAMRPGPVPYADRIVLKPSYRWFIYDDPNQGYYRINQIAALLDTAYTTTVPQFTTANAVGLIETGNLSAEIKDDTLNLFVRFLDISLLVV
jgi:hypothetical protein